MRPFPAPPKAVNRLTEQVTGEMGVKAAKDCPHRSQMFLDPEEGHPDPTNGAVAVTETGAAKFQGVRMADPGRPSQGQTIRVQGVVALKDNRPRIEVDDPQQIETVQST